MSLLLMYHRHDCRKDFVRSLIDRISLTFTLLMQDTTISVIDAISNYYTNITTR